MLESAKQVLSGRIETMQEEGLLALLEETFPYVSHLQRNLELLGEVCAKPTPYHALHGTT